MEDIEFKQSEKQIKEQADENSDIKEKKLNQNRSQSRHANLWIINYLQITGTSWVIGLNMTQEVYEMLEHGNNKKQSQYYVDLAIVRHFELNESKKALKCLKQAIKWDSQNYEAYALEGNIYKYIGNMEGNQKEYYERSQKSLSKSLAINPNCRLAQLYQAHLYYSTNKDYSKQLFESILNKGKLSYEESYPEILAQASGLLFLEKYQEALDVYNTAINIHPQATCVYRTIGHCYYQQTEYQEAIKYYNKYLETHVKLRKRIGQNLGHCYYHLKKYDLAIEEWKLYLEVCPENRKDKYNRQIKRAQEFIRLNENDNE